MLWLSGSENFSGPSRNGPQTLGTRLFPLLDGPSNTIIVLVDRDTNEFFVVLIWGKRSSGYEDFLNASPGKPVGITKSHKFMALGVT